MLYATIAASFSYIPVICVTKFAKTSFQNQAIAFYSAYYIPQFVLVCAFSVRLYIITKKLSDAEEGPWSREGRASSIVFISNEDKAEIAAKAIAAAVEAEAKAANDDEC